MCLVRATARADRGWKGRGEQYYCNGFCAEAEQVDWPPLAASELPAIEERGHA
jgi:hypothetical protein